MQLKDYYTILQLPPSASLPEIKKAYRQLAQQYHPDKNNNDMYAAMQFAEIKEAYEMLSNPARKEQYLQQRWYYQSMGGKMGGTGSLTPPAVLKQCLELNRYVASLDVHRVDREGLAGYISHILSGFVPEQLELFNDRDINHQVIISLLKTMDSLKRDQVEKISAQLLQLAGDDTDTKKIISETLDRKKQKEKQEKYMPFIIILMTVVICLLIWLMGR